MLYSNENMIYPNNFEQRIGIDTIRQFVTEKCLSTLGEEKVAAMDFSIRLCHHWQMVGANRGVFTNLA